MSDEGDILRRMRERDAQLAQERQRLEAMEPKKPDSIVSLVPSLEEYQEAMRKRGEEDRQAAERERAARERSERQERERRAAYELEQAPLRAALRDGWSVDALQVAPPAVRNLIASDAFDPSSVAVRSARSWARGERRGLVLRGGVGNGKTVAAACALAEYNQRDSMRRGRPLTWHRPNDFTSGMLHSYDDKAPKIGREMVVIDDVGRETKGDFEEALVVLIDDHLTRFVLTTNLTVEELEKRYGERLIDRLKAECTFVALAGSSLRRKP
jgi:DNA replication protein DnaC